MCAGAVAKGVAMALQVDYCESFRLICTTRWPNPHYTPELSAKVTIVDFTVTMAGLEDQLLGVLILKVSPLPSPHRHIVLMLCWAPIWNTDSGNGPSAAGLTHLPGLAFLIVRHQPPLGLCGTP